MSSLPPQRGVLVAHPGRQYSHRLAGALEQAGLLYAYLTGIPSRGQFSRWLPERITRRWRAYDPPRIDQEKIKLFPVAPAAINITQRLRSSGSAKAIEHQAYNLFDWVCASMVYRNRRKLSAVVAYENSAVRTFKAAKRAGVVTVLDAAALHYSTQDRFLRDDVGGKLLERRIRLRKDEEIRLADHVIVTSEFARESYLAAGVPLEKLHVVPLGVDNLFSSTNEKRRLDNFTFGFIGATSFRKGTDVLLGAMSQIIHEGILADLYLIGRVQSGYQKQIGDLASRVTCPGQLGHEELAQTLRGVNCVVLPSRIDSFGMAVIEALACGIPVIVTDHVGANIAVDEGRTGWIVPHGDVTALAEAMKWVAQNAQAVEQMAPACRSAAQRFTWDIYSKRIVNLFEQILPARMPVGR